MTEVTLHDDEVLTNADMVRSLVSDQFPQWASLPLTRVGQAGVNNAIYRLGPELVVRMPRKRDAIEQLLFERDTLPWMAAQLPIALPEQVALGRPDHGFPYEWGIYRWKDGEHPVVGDQDATVVAEGLGEFVAALHRLDATGARAGYRTGPLAAKDDYVREWAPKAAHLIDPEAVLRVWDEALAAPAWDGPPVWAHSDLIPGNVLVADDRLAAVLDFGASGAGDPACDAVAAWTLLPAGSRARFREVAGFDDATWARARGWAMTFVGGMAHYWEINPALATSGHQTITDVLAEFVAE